MREEKKAAIYAAYLGICVLKTMCKKAGLNAGEKRSQELLDELGSAFPFIGERVALSALRGGESVETASPEQKDK